MKGKRFWPWQRRLRGHLSPEASRTQRYTLIHIFGIIIAIMMIIIINYNHKWWSRLWDFETFIGRPHQRYTLIHIFLGKLGPGQLCYAQFLVMILMTLVIMITMIVIGHSSVHAQSFDDHDPWKPVLQHNKVSTFNVKWRKMCWKFGWNPFSVGQDIKISLGINFAWHFYWNI